MKNAHTLFFCRGVIRNRLIVMHTAAAFILDTAPQDRQPFANPLPIWQILGKP